VDINIKNGKLLIGTEGYPNLNAVERIGGGANGEVYLMHNPMLDRCEALKIFTKSGDVKGEEQAVNELRRTVKADEKYAIKVYAAHMFHGYTISCMEYFEGETLCVHIADKDPLYICWILRRYLQAIEETSSINAFHGDAHAKNVLIKRSMGNLKIKPC